VRHTGAAGGAVGTPAQPDAAVGRCYISRPPQIRLQCRHLPHRPPHGH
jgi:hypothetical protein